MGSCSEWLESVSEELVGFSETKSAFVGSAVSEFGEADSLLSSSS